MNASTIRRLASDHSSLHKSGLPPNYLFASDSGSSLPDDLTQLTVLLTGPQGTPYSQGLWKLCLKIPQDYPKSPPKAAFRTRIWHPNVDENTGSVCVDTLKKDWESKLTLRDILMTITCLLIQPNPDSALNSTAGHLLQVDYEAFARHAKLMTSIHARIPPLMKDSVLEAKQRGEEVRSAMRDECDEQPLTKTKSSSSSSIIMKKAQTIIPGLPGVVDSQKSICEQCSDSEMDYNEASASKENDPSQSPSPVMAQSPRRSTLAKRPLSDLPAPPELDSEDDGTVALSPSERNIIANTPYLSSPVATPGAESPSHNLKLTEKSWSVKFTSQGLHNGYEDGLGAAHFDIKVDAEVEQLPAQKRLRVWAEKENSSEVHMTNSKSCTPAAVVRSVSGLSGVTSLPLLAPMRPIFHKPVAGSNMLNKNTARSRMGLRRL